MKKTGQILTIFALGAILIPLHLSSCADAGGTTAPNDNLSTDTSQNITLENETHNIDVDSYETQITYYMELAKSLQDELLALKEESYVEACEKDLKIGELEKKIESLQKTISTMSNGEYPKLDGEMSDPSFDQIVSMPDYEYEEIDGGIIITRYIGCDSCITVPTEINGLPVYEIGDGAFKGCSARSVTIPSSVTKIGWFAFEGCTYLESVSLPSSVMSIGYGVFNSSSSSVNIVCEQGSYAEKYAKSWGLPVILE